MKFPAIMKIALVHYAYPPVIGGVEFVMEQQAALFARRGHTVRIIAGRAESTVDGVSVDEIPELLPTHPLNEQSQAEIAGDGPAPAYEELKSFLKGRLEEALQDCQVVFVHNMMTMHFNLAATAALAELAAEGTVASRFVNWVHDIAAIDENYALGELLGGEPWSLLAGAPQCFKHAAISKKRQQEYCELAGIDAGQCPVVPNGVRYIRLLKLTDPVRKLCRQYGVLYQDIVMLQPTRILRRKNIEFGIRVLAELKRAGHKVVYLVTGATDAHNPAARDYGRELRELAGDLGVDNEFHFLSETFEISDEDLVSIYNASDLLFLPSRQEGFGLPLLEAGVFRIPAFCARVEPMCSILENNVNLFDLAEEPAAVARRVAATLGDDPGYRARKEVIKNYSWERLFDERINPLFLG